MLLFSMCRVDETNLVSCHKRKKTSFVSPHAVEIAKLVIHYVTQCTVCALKNQGQQAVTGLLMHLVFVYISLKISIKTSVFLYITLLVYVKQKEHRVPRGENIATHTQTDTYTHVSKNLFSLVLFPCPCCLVCEESTRGEPNTKWPLSF